MEDTGSSRDLIRHGNWVSRHWPFGNQLKNGSIFIQIKFLLLFGILLCLLVVAAAKLAAAQPAQERLPAKLAEAALERAISSVYPALVQVYVLALDYAAGRERKFQASGSGVIISAEGHVLTNHHVAGKAAAIRCVLSNREELDAKLVGTDALTDLSVLKLDLSSRPAGSPPLAVARFGSSRALKVGETVLAMGCPLAISQSVTRGIVSNKDMIIPRLWNRSFLLDGENVGSLVKWIAHDAQIFPGNSGGPLVNLQGGIVGINEIAIGLAGAIPSDLASEVAKDLIVRGRVLRAWTGADFQPLLKTTAAGGGPQGVLVAGVLPGSPAESVGIRPGDVVLAVDGTPVQVRFLEELPVFMQMMLSKVAGMPIDLRLRRAGRELTLAVQPEALDNAKRKELEAKEWGLTVRRLTWTEAREMLRADRQGVLVGSVRAGGPANLAVPALAASDVIVEVGGKPVPDLTAFLKITTELAQGKSQPVPTVVAFERGAERQLTVVEVGIRLAQDTPAEAKKAWLPVGTQVLSRKLAAALGLKGKKGVRITQVYPGSSAEQAGLKAGDVLTHVDGQLIEASEPQDAEVFGSMLRAYRPGSKAEFTLIRNGQTFTITSALVEAPKPEQELEVYEDVAFEFRARDISLLDRVRNRWSEQESGAVVSQVETGGWAAVAGLQAGDLIQSVGGQRVAELKDLQPLLKTARDERLRHVILFVKRGIHTFFLELEPKWPEKQ
ncbi:MAG: hypothetical protein DMG06_20735 [Acidobacteria bacterium]|nr:MAG: hypothetical protein DMG06_20735 [Acidobacteriota bacterium]